MIISREAESKSNCKNVLFISSLQLNLLPCKVFIKSSSDGDEKRVLSIILLASHISIHSLILVLSW